MARVEIIYCIRVRSIQSTHKDIKFKVKTLKTYNKHTAGEKDVK